MCVNVHCTVCVCMCECALRSVCVHCTVCVCVCECALYSMCVYVCIVQNVCVCALHIVGMCVCVTVLAVAFTRLFSQKQRQAKFMTTYIDLFSALIPYTTTRKTLISV